jgi:hypothetical protein
LRAGLSGGRGDAGRPGCPIAGLRDYESDSESESGEELLAEVKEDLAGEQVPWLPGRLQGHLNFWRSFTASRFVLSVISLGYILKWEDGPPPPVEAGCFGDNYAFTCESVAKLRAQGAIRRCSRKDLTCVLAMDMHSNSAGKRRLIVDARLVNKFERGRKFKCETLAKEGRDIFEDALLVARLTYLTHIIILRLRRNPRRTLGSSGRGSTSCGRYCPLA